MIDQRQGKGWGRRKKQKGSCHEMGHRGKEKDPCLDGDISVDRECVHGEPVLAF